MFFIKMVQIHCFCNTVALLFLFFSPDQIREREWRFLNCTQQKVRNCLLFHLSLYLFIIMKFLCSTCSHWFKKCTLREYKPQKKGKFTFIIRRNGGWVSEIFLSGIIQVREIFSLWLGKWGRKGIFSHPRSWSCQCNLSIKWIKLQPKY